MSLGGCRCLDASQLNMSYFLRALACGSARAHPLRFSRSGSLCPYSLHLWYVALYLVQLTAPGNCSIRYFTLLLSSPVVKQGVLSECEHADKYVNTSNHLFKVTHNLFLLQFNCLSLRMKVNFSLLSIKLEVKTITPNTSRVVL